MEELLEKLEVVAQVVSIRALGPGNTREWVIRQAVARQLGLMSKEQTLSRVELDQIVSLGTLHPRGSGGPLSRKAFLYKAVSLLEQKLEAQIP